jgi:hypothetical protein
MDIYEARTEAIQEEIIVQTDTHQERWEPVWMPAKKWQRPV